MFNQHQFEEDIRGQWASFQLAKRHLAQQLSMDVEDDTLFLGQNIGLKFTQLVEYPEAFDILERIRSSIIYLSEGTFGEIVDHWPSIHAGLSKPLLSADRLRDFCVYVQQACAAAAVDQYCDSISEANMRCLMRYFGHTCVDSLRKDLICRAAALFHASTES